MQAPHRNSGDAIFFVQLGTNGNLKKRLHSTMDMKVNLDQCKIDRQQNVPRQVYTILRNRIQSAELAPGSSINERYLSEFLGVSRTPIREAIRKLSDDGLITIIPNVGTTVTPLNPERIIECCTVRLSLECIAIEAAVKNFNHVADLNLRRLIEEQEETVESGDLTRNIAVDTEFHRVILALSGFKFIQSIVKTTMSEITRARHLSIKLQGRKHKPTLEHRVILEALRTGNPEKCFLAMRDHLTKSSQSIYNVVADMGHKHNAD
jgi:GntR family transcriptional regulator, rspAB operon transcriptional repressor